MAKILFDMDGTIADWVGSAIDVLGANYDDPEMKEARRRMKRTEGFWRDLKPIARGFAVLGVARGLGHICAINSKKAASAPNCHDEKMEWCAKFVPTLEVNLAASIEEKASVPGDVHVEDYVEHAEAWLRENRHGRVILMDNPGNRGFDHPRVLRYTGSNLDEVNNLLRTV